MKFRPCIDIHNGQVKQIVGKSLKDKGNQADENFVSNKKASYYANLYKRDGLTGGHIILLNSVDSEYYIKNCELAKEALNSYPMGLQIGGGITDENAEYFLKQGASHVIVTSYVFQNGMIYYDNLERLVKKISKERLVLDLSCKKKQDGYYYIMTDRWQTFTKEKLDHSLLDSLSSYCDEFLVHAVDVEGKASGIEKELIILLADWGKCPITYAGGVGNFEDLESLRQLSYGKLDVTIGSAIDLFGGKMQYSEVVKRCK